MNEVKTLNPAWIKFILPLINRSPFFKKENMKIIELKYGEALIEIDIERKHLQAYGFVHGGVYGGLIDAAGWWAVYTQVEAMRNAFTVEMKLNYLASANKGKFIAYGQCIKLGKTLGLGTAIIKSEEGKLLAHGTVTVMLTDNLVFTDNVPEKYI